MGCEDFQNLLADALGNELDESSRLAFEEHLVRCEPCRREYDEACRTLRTLRELPPPSMHVARHQDQLIIGPRRRRRARFGLSLLRYAAVVLIAFLGGFAFRGAMFESSAGSFSAAGGSKTIVARASGETLESALRRAHLHDPNRSDLTKAMIAVFGTLR